MTDTEFEERLPQTAQTLTLIALAMCGGLAMLAGITAFLYFTNPPKEVPPDFLGVLPALSAANAGLFVAGWIAGRVVHEKMLSGGPAGQSATEKLQTATIVLLATREGPGLLGLVACLLAVLTGVGARHPLFFLNSLSAIAFWVSVLNGLPNQENLRELYRTKLAGRLSPSSGANPAAP